MCHRVAAHVVNHQCDSAAHVPFQSCALGPLCIHRAHAIMQHVVPLSMQLYIASRASDLFVSRCATASQHVRYLRLLCDGHFLEEILRGRLGLAYCCCYRVVDFLTHCLAHLFSILTVVGVAKTSGSCDMCATSWNVRIIMGPV